MDGNVAVAKGGEFVGEDGAEPEFFAEPARNGGGKGAETTRCNGKRGGEDALEFKKRLFVVNDGVERTGGLGQAVRCGGAGERRIVFDACETLFLGGGY